MYAYIQSKVEVGENIGHNAALPPLKIILM